MACVSVRCVLKCVEIKVDIPNVVAIFLCDLDLYVIVVYRPPSYRQENNMTLISVLLKLCLAREVVVMGDFNLPTLDWSTDGNETRGARTIDSVFSDSFVAAGQTQWVREPTFVQSGNILDLMLTSE